LLHFNSFEQNKKHHKAHEALRCMYSEMVGLGGLEPQTSSMSTPFWTIRMNQISSSPLDIAHFVEPYSTLYKCNFDAQFQLRGIKILG